MRPRSTESSLPWIGRHCVLTCGQSWPIMPSFYSSSSLSRPSSLSSWLSTSLHHLHRSDHQGSPLTLYCFYLTSGDTGYFVWGGGGGGVGGGGGGGDVVIGYSVFFFFFFFVVLVLVVCSIFSCSTYWLCFVFSISCSCRWCLGLVSVYFVSHFYD